MLSSPYDRRLAEFIFGAATRNTTDLIRDIDAEQWIPLDGTRS